MNERTASLKLVVGRSYRDTLGDVWSADGIKTGGNGEYMETRRLKDGKIIGHSMWGTVALWGKSALDFIEEV